jgi:tetratricopeptide (TPR) repeat protein
MTVPAELVDRINQGNVVLFLGAGATRDAGGPVGSDLAQLLGAKFGRPDIPTDNLLLFADVLTSLPEVDREDVDAAIIQSLSDLTPSRAHYALPRFWWRAIFTTNYDRLIERAYENAKERNGEVAAQTPQVLVGGREHASFSDRNQVPVFKLHGCIANVVSRCPLVLTSQDYERTAKQRSKMLRTLREFSKQLTVLFIGYSFPDRSILNMLDQIERESPYNTHRRMYVVAPDPSGTQREFFSSRNVECVSETFTGLFEQLLADANREATRAYLAQRLAPVRLPGWQCASIPQKLRVALEPQLEQITPDAYPREDAEPFFRGCPARIGDLRAGHDVGREAGRHLLEIVRPLLASDDYLRPVVAVLGAGGAGKSTLALRVAYDIAASGEAAAFRLKSHDLWNRHQLVQFAGLLPVPSVFVIENLELRACVTAAKELRAELSNNRCRVLLLISCQKAVWNSVSRFFSDPASRTIVLPDQLCRTEADELVSKLAQHQLLALAGTRDRTRRVDHVLNECGGNLVVAMLTLVGSDTFRNIILGEYENLSERAQGAYKCVALLHQHRLSVPDYVLNKVTVNDWDVFTNEVIRLESDLIIVQDVNYGTGRIQFTTRHPEIARTVVDAVIPRHEDRIRMYRKIIQSLGASEEDRKFLVSLLTTTSIRDEIRETKYVQEFFDAALDLFPEDLQLLLHLGKFENRIGNLDRAHETLAYARTLEPRDSYIVHQLGVNYQKRALACDDGLIRDATFREAERLFRLKQDLDPTSHYGFASQARSHLERARLSEDDDGRLDQLSAAYDAIQRGLSLVRDDERSALEECKAEWANALGNAGAVVALLQPQIVAHNLRYASSYHLLAVCHFQRGDPESARAVITAGLAAFPGDDRLIGALVHSMEEKLHDPVVRQACEELIDAWLHGPLPVGIAFVRAVLLFYEGNFARARQEFSDLRSSLGRRAPTRIRVFYSDVNGAPKCLQGPLRLNTENRLQVMDPGTGYWVPVDNRALWHHSGKPAEAQFQLGFSLAGFRALMVETAARAVV